MIIKYIIQSNRFAVEWSLCDDFGHIEGCMLTNDITKSTAVISGLKRGLRYSVRVSAASIHGYSQPTQAAPQLLLISSKFSNKKKLSALNFSV